ncbi:hypothetical protein H5410_060273 [Solanum commersonii]|uniref:Uncharacterized protein n=1 Tax=Solanum commersonii TaxID=4109 RepID=A0A9J5W4M2_SOLCO|nr:hypothetical protein H5410_060273 [Solanum commersonii]
MLLMKSTLIKTSDSDKEEIERDALSVIQLSLAPNVLYEMSTSTEEMAKELWKRLEGLYRTDAFSKLVMDLQTTRIKKDDEMLACALLFSLTSKYHDIENSMMYSKEPIPLEQVRQALNSCDVRMHFEGDKASGIFVRGRTSQ